MSQYRTELKWAAIFTVMSLLWMFLEKALGWHDELIHKHPEYTMLFIIPAAIVYYIALMDVRNSKFKGRASWKQMVLAGIIMSVFVAVLAIPAQWAVNNIISPDYFENAIEYAVQSGKASREIAKKSFNPQSYMLMAPIFSFFYGAVISAFIALIVKKN